MAYNYNNFLKPINDGDKNILIFNESGELVYTLNPFSVINTQVRGNIITISVKSGRTILLDFLNSNLALNALPILQNRILQLTNETPNFIDKQIDKWSEANTTQRISTILSSPTFSFGSASFNDVIPIEDDTFSLGRENYKWNELYVNFAHIDNPQFDYTTIQGRPFDRTDFDRFVNTQMEDPHGGNPKVGQDIVIKDANMYFDGTSSIRFTNFDGTASHKLISVWDWDGPLGSTHTIYPEFESTYNERAQISYKIEDGEKSSLSLKTFDWTGGSQSGIEHEYKFYEGDIILPEGKHLYSGGLRFSNRITGTSQDLLTVLDVGFYYELTTQKYLSFQRGISVIVSNGLEDFYVDDDYYDDATGAVMISIVDSYNESTGLLGLYVEKPIGLGRTASSWSINISGRQSTVILGTTASFEELTVTGTTILQQVVEKLNTSTQSSNIVYDFNLGSIWYHNDLTSDYNADFINVPTYSNTAISTNIIIEQSGTGYLPTTLSINGATQNITWVGGTPSMGTADVTEIVGFSFINYDGTFVDILGQVSNGLVAGGGSNGPQGFQGSTGPQGDQGSTGPQGDQGLTGPQGLQGETGPQGFQGETGPQGLQGETGPQGPIGFQGPTGPSISPIVGSWSLAAGANTVSFTVAGGQSYVMWVNGNIPNGIVNWNATVTLSNTNVPVIGVQYGWYYLAGNALVLTSIPNQIVGVEGIIATASPGFTNSNTFTFGIDNNSGSSQIIYYGYTQVS